jgi:superfamily II DNA or RNA helicase
MSAATEKALTPSEVTAISVPLMERTRQHIESVLARRQAEAEAKAAAERLAKEAAERAAQEAAKRAEQETRKAVEREAKILAALNMTAEEFAAMTPKSQRIAAHNARLAGKLKD